MLTITVAEDERKAQDQIKESLMKRVNTMTAASMQSRLQSYQNPGIQVPCSGGVGTLGILDSNGYNPSQYSPKYETTYAQFVDENIVANVKRNKSGKIVSTTNIDTRASQITTSSHISINPMMNFEHTHVIRYGKFCCALCYTVLLTTRQYLQNRHSRRSSRGRGQSLKYFMSCNNNSSSISSRRKYKIILKPLFLFSCNNAMHIIPFQHSN